MTIRIAIAQIRPKKADYAENLRRVGSVFATAGEWDPPADLIVFPESVMSGYFLEGGVREAAVTAGDLYRDLHDQHAVSGAPPVEVAVGFYEEFRNRYYNTALYAGLGEPNAGIRHVHRKVFLPTYGLFDEQRFVEHGDSIRAFDTRWGRAAMLICEDVWHSITGTLAALDGAQLIIVLSAAPARGTNPESNGDQRLEGRPASVRRWERLVRHVAEEHGVYVALAQLVGFEGGKGFQGGSELIAPDGAVVVRGPVFEEALIQADLEFDAITRARADQPLLASLRTQFQNLLKDASQKTRVGVEYDAARKGPSVERQEARAEHSIVVPAHGGDPLDIDCELTERWLVAFLEDEVVKRRGFEKGIVGLSGGVDSSLTAAVAARALGSQNVIGVRMPYSSSSPESLAHAEQIAEQLSIQLETIDISRAVDGYFEASDREADPRRRGNVMARIRMTTLFDLSAKYDALPLGTGNKTERLLGYFTWHADDSPPVNPLGDLLKTQVWMLARHLGVPEEILSKPPTADLVEGQTDESDLGISYERADRILYWLLKGHRRDQLLALGFKAEEVDLVNGRLQGTHWKRRLPTVAMVSETAIGESYLRPVDY